MRTRTTTSGQAHRRRPVRRSLIVEKSSNQPNTLTGQVMLVLIPLVLVVLVIYSILNAQYTAVHLFVCIILLLVYSCLGTQHPEHLFVP